MKFAILTVGVLAASGNALPAQGAFVYDQRSNMDEAWYPYPAFIAIQDALQPFGQSFTPALTSLDFIQLKLGDATPGNSLGCTWIVNVRSGGVTGPILGTSQPVFMPDGFGGVTNFLFETPVSLAAGTQYYFDPQVTAGDRWKIDIYEYNYHGGSLIRGGVAMGRVSMWFGEGIIVPEPGTGAVLGLGLGLLAWVRRPRAS